MKIHTATRSVHSQVLAIEPKKRKSGLLKRLLPLLVFFLFAIFIGYVVYRYYFMPRAVGKLQTETFVISSKRSALIEQMNAKYGSEVQAGEVLVVLDTNELEAKKREVEKAVVEAQLNIGATKGNLQLRQDELRLRLADNLIFRAIDMETARSVLKEDNSTLESAIEKLKGAEIELNRRLKLVKTGAVAQAQVDEVQTRYNALTKEIENYEKVVKSGEKRLITATQRYDEYNEKDINVPIEEMMKPVIAHVDTVRSEIDVFKAMITNSILRSPSHGYVSMVHHRSLGSGVDIAEPILTIINGTDDLVEAYVRERWRNSVTVGKKVMLYPVSRTGKLQGTIISIAEGISRIPANYLEPYEQERIDGLRFMIKLEHPWKDGPMGSTFDILFE